VASIAGNLATASPIADLNPVLLACGASVTLAAAGGASRAVGLGEFFLGYRTTALQPGEVIVSITVPATREHEYVLPFKQAKRRDDDISIVTCGLRLRFQPSAGDASGWRVADASFAFGGMAAKTVGAPKAAAACVGRAWSVATLDEASAALSAELALPEDVPGGMAHFRRTLAASFLFKAYLQTVQLLEGSVDGGEGQGEGQGGAPEGGKKKHPPLDARERSGGESFLTAERPLSGGVQAYAVDEPGGLHRAAHELTAGAEAAQGGAVAMHAPDTRAGAEVRAPVGLPVMHRSAEAQVSGHAKYCDDIVAPPGTLHAALVMSEQPHARIVAVDAAAALATAGVRGFFDHRDVDGSNAIGAIFKDEECFREQTVQCVGQPIGVVVADTVALAQEAARAVKVTYAALGAGAGPGEDQTPACFTIEDAIEAGSYFEGGKPHVITQGDVESALQEEGLVVVEGEMRIGGQEHFYLETNATLCVPGEDDEMVVHSSTQNPSKTQMFVAGVLGIPSSCVTCKVKRMGGGFGGKETRSVFIACAVGVAAKKLQRPVKINVERDVDMMITGQRHPFVAKYRAGLHPGTGKLAAMDVSIYANGGYSFDLTGPVRDRALFHCDNVLLLLLLLYYYHHSCTTATFLTYPLTNFLLLLLPACLPACLPTFPRCTSSRPSAPVGTPARPTRPPTRPSVASAGRRGFSSPRRCSTTWPAPRAPRRRPAPTCRCCPRA
jgi:xanthine dehydrogenase/oxidase